MGGERELKQEHGERGSITWPFTLVERNVVVVVGGSETKIWIEIKMAISIREFLKVG